MYLNSDPLQILTRAVMNMTFLLLDYVQLSTSLLNIFYTTAQLSRQVRLQQKKETQIKTVSMATVALIIWRSLIVGSRILIFVLFALLFQYWLFVVIGFHYLLMFALVFFQMRLKEIPCVSKIIYNVVTPLIYIFDFCINWLEGPSRYWYVMAYVPMYCENLLMSGLGLWYASTTPSPAWYIVPGCVCVMVMFPLGVLVQLAYYRYWHPNNLTRQLAIISPDNEPKQTIWLQHMTWSEFRTEVNKAQTNVDERYVTPNKRLMQHENQSRCMYQNIPTYW